MKMKKTYKHFLVLILIGFICSMSLFSQTSGIKTKTVTLGDVLKVEVLADYPISNIQWFKDGVPIKGATNREFIVKSARLSDQGVYFASMQGPCHEMKSSDLFVRIDMPAQPNVETLEAGGDFLFQNEPNPAGDEIRFKFNLSEKSYIKLIISDLFGKEVAIPFEGFATTGLNTIDFSATKFNLVNGTYFYTLVSDKFQATKSLVILR
jgi:hypothetical protein